MGAVGIASGKGGVMSGFEKPNYTQAPNAFFDRVLKEIDSMSELKVTLAVIRHTMGFHRDEHELSLSYLVEYTGLRKETVIDGLRRAMKRGTVTRKESGQSFAYSMKVVGKPDHLEGQSGRKTGPQVVGKPDPRKKEKESNTSKDVEASASPGQFVGYLREELDGADVPLLRNREERYAGEFNRLIKKGVASDVLYKACDRIVERWKDDEHRKLTAEQALEDVVNGKPPAHSNGHSRDYSKPPPWEPVNPHSPKPLMDPAAYEREKKRREEVAAMLRSVS